MSGDTKDLIKFILIVIAASAVFGAACPNSGGGDGDSWDNPGWRYDR